MDSTPNRGYPYPECDPPLTKDASDIAQLRDLAQAVADDVQAIVDRSDDVLVRPDSARMSGTGMGVDQQIFPVFTASTFDSTGGAMTVGTGGVMRLIEPGWYLVGAQAQAVTATALQLRLTFLLNGVRVTSWSPPGSIVATNQQAAQHSGWVVVDNPNAELSVHLRNGAATPSFSYTVSLWAQQMARP